MKSRIQILDDLAIKFGHGKQCRSFNDFLDSYDSEAIIRLVMLAMSEIELQGMKSIKIAGEGDE